MLPFLKYPDYHHTVPKDSDSLWAGVHLTLPNYYNPISVNKRRNSWYLRILDDMKYNHKTGEIEEKSAYFITLTYEDTYLPYMVDIDTGETASSLCPSDPCNFVKRLRYHLTKESGFPFRYMKAEEYGSVGTLRPHYHFMIITNSDFFTLQECVRKSWSSEIDKTEFDRFSLLNSRYRADDRRYVPVFQVHSGRNGSTIRYYRSMGFALTEIPRNGEKCASYVAKYVAKLPDDLKSDKYLCKRPRVSASLRFGIGYALNKANRYYHRFNVMLLRGDLLKNFELWSTKYRHTGLGEFKYALPKSYKKVLYTDKERFMIGRLFQQLKQPVKSDFQRYIEEFTGLKRLHKQSLSFIT